MDAQASKFKTLSRRTLRAHDKALLELKTELAGFLPPKKWGRNRKVDSDVAEDSDVEEAPVRNGYLSSSASNINSPSAWTGFPSDECL